MLKPLINSSVPISIATSADAVLALYGLELAVCHKRGSVGDIKHSFAATEKAQHLLSHHPTTSLNSGLQLLKNSNR